MVTRSREIAMSEKLDEKEYKDVYEHSDLRYKIHLGHMDYKSTSRDVPMGLALTADKKDFFENQKLGGDHSGAVGPVGAGYKTEPGKYELDAMGGKGAKGKGDGKCHVCSCDGHLAR